MSPSITTAFCEARPPLLVFVTNTQTLFCVLAAKTTLGSVKLLCFMFII